MARTRAGVRDFLDMGVAEVWVIDPATRPATVCSGATMVEQTGGTLTGPGAPVILALADIFKILDRRR